MLRFSAFIVALLVSAPVAAVSCGGPPSVKQAYAAAKNVFSAHVEEIHAAPGFGRDRFRFAKMRILHVWKGSLRPGDIVSATAEDSISFVSDGFVSRPGSDVLVYAGATEPFILGTCSTDEVRFTSAEVNLTPSVPHLWHLVWQPLPQLHPWQQTPGAGVHIIIQTDPAAVRLNSSVRRHRR